jgi:hypothetical protein
MTTSVFSVERQRIISCVSVPKTAVKFWLVYLSVYFERTCWLHAAEYNAVSAAAINMLTQSNNKWCSRWNSETTFLSPCYRMSILNFNSPPCFHYSFFAKVVSLKVVYPLRIYQNVTLHGPTLIGVNFTSTPKVWTSAILEWLQLQH